MNETIEVDLDKLKENKLYKEIMPLPSDDDYNALKESISKYGIKIPLSINENYEIIDGYCRYKIAKEIGLKKLPCKILPFKDKLEEQEYIITVNLHRRHLNNAQKAEIGLKLLEIEKERAKERQKIAGKLYGIKHPKKKVVQNFGQPFETGRAFEIVAKKIGISDETLRKAEKIKKTMEKDEKIKKLWDEAIKGRKSIDAVYKMIEREEKIKELEEKIKELPTLSGKYQVIVIDPPWKYGTKYNPEGRRVASPYPEMSIEELEKINLPADDNCILWLWTTNAFLHDAFHLMEKWGFEYKTMLTWVKDKIGVGDWLRGQTEHCLLGVKGKPLIKLTNQSTVLFAPNRGHSRKPDEFYEMVNSLCIGRKLDYFGTKKRDGWDVYGTIEY